MQKENYLKLKVSLCDRSRQEMILKGLGQPSQRRGCLHPDLRG